MPLTLRAGTPAISDPPPMKEAVHSIQPATIAVDELEAVQQLNQRYQDILHQVGGFVWWTPYRIRRWPLSSTIP